MVSNYPYKLRYSYQMWFWSALSEVGVMFLDRAIDVCDIIRQVTTACQPALLLEAMCEECSSVRRHDRNVDLVPRPALWRHSKNVDLVTRPVLWCLWGYIRIVLSFIFTAIRFLNSSYSMYMLWPSWLLRDIDMYPIFRRGPSRLRFVTCDSILIVMLLFGHTSFSGDCGASWK